MRTAGEAMPTNKRSGKSMPDRAPFSTDRVPRSASRQDDGFPFRGSRQQGQNHANNLLPEVYTIPVYVWGCGAAVGKDLYKLNVATRRDPGNGHPLHTDPVQPIRNGDGANLALKLFGLGPVPGSTINREQDLTIGR